MSCVAAIHLHIPSPGIGIMNWIHGYLVANWIRLIYAKNDGLLISRALTHFPLHASPDESGGTLPMEDIE